MRLISFLCFGCFITSASILGQTNASKFDISVRKVDKIQMLYYEFTGPYDKSFNEFGQLMAFIQQNNIKMGNFSLGIFYDDPSTVAEDKLRSNIGQSIILQNKIKSEHFKFKEIPAGKAVTVRYKSMEDIMPAYAALEEYLKQNNLKTEEYSVELYYGQDPNTIDAEILFYLKD